jgi:hypothetical protein
MYRIKSIKPLGECSKTHSIGGELADIDTPSEWAVNFAFMKVGIGNETNDEELFKLVQEGMMAQVLTELSDEGLIDMVWDDGEVKFRITKKGVEYHENQ